MSGKPEADSAGVVSASAGAGNQVQNVVVYVSDGGGFAQAYAVDHGGHLPGAAAAPTSYHPLVAKQQSPLKPPPDYDFFAPGGGGGYAVNGVSEAVETTRDGCSSADSSGYVSGALGGDGGPPSTSSTTSSQGARCDSVRSEAAESSCSSLGSSADEGQQQQPASAPPTHHHHQQQQQHHPHEMLVYETSAGAASGVRAHHHQQRIVLAVGAPAPPPAPLLRAGAAAPHLPYQQVPIAGSATAANVLVVAVPYGWKRLLTNGAVVYLSPSNTALSSSDQVKEYLLTPGTCKCGLECPLKYETVFNFDPKVSSKPWTFPPDTNPGDLTKLCNHKRKIMAMASLGCKPSDSKFRKDFGMKKKKRRTGSPYSGIPVSQILAQREKLALSQQMIPKDGGANTQFENQVWSGQQMSTHPQNHPGNRIYSDMVNATDPRQFLRYSNPDAVMETVSISDTIVTSQTSTNISHHQQQQQQQQQVQNQKLIQQNYHMSNCNAPQVQIHQQQQQQHVVGPNGQMISVQGAPMNANMPPHHHHHQHHPGHVLTNGPNGIIIHGGPNLMTGAHPPQHQKIFVNDGNIPGGRPNVHMLPVNQPNKPDMHQQRMPPNYCNQLPYPGIVQQQQFDPSRTVRPAFAKHDGQQFVAHNAMDHGAPVFIGQQPARAPWCGRGPPINPTMATNAYERVPPLHHHTPTPIWPDEAQRKKCKPTKSVKKRSFTIFDSQQRNQLEQQQQSPQCPNIDVRQLAADGRNAMMLNHHSPQSSHGSASPSFMEDPSGYLAQQTALLNSTISRQTGANVCGGLTCHSPIQSSTQPSSNEVPLPSNMLLQSSKPAQVYSRTNQKSAATPTQQSYEMAQQQQQYNQSVVVADSTGNGDRYLQCRDCIADYQKMEGMAEYRIFQNGASRPNSQPGTPTSSTVLDDPVTSSTYSDKSAGNSPDSRPIQGGTISTSNVSPADNNSQSSSPSTPNPHTPSTPPQSRNTDTPHLQAASTTSQYATISSPTYTSREQLFQAEPRPMDYFYKVSVAQATQSSRVGSVTTMASGRTVGSNTITSVLAGRANTSTVSVNAAVTNTSTAGLLITSPQTVTVNVSKTPLEMVQSVVSSIQVPHSQHGVMTSSFQQNAPLQIIKHSPTQTLPPGHIFVSSGGQLIMANTSNGQPNVMPPPPPKLVANQNGAGAMPPISVSPMVTNVTAAVTQVIPAVAPQVLGQQTVLVNALPAPFVLQQGVAMTMDGMQNVQIPQLVTGNVIQQQQQQLQVDGGDSNRMLGRGGAMLSPETTKRKGKKRKISSQTIASMLQIASQQNAGVVMSSQPSFPQQLHMTHSPQAITAAPVMQALTIVSGKNGGAPQLVMNGQHNTGQFGQQLIAANAQQTQQINLLQPVNLINGTAGVVQNFPTIQQFIVPNLGGMVMNADGTATLLQDTSNLGMQLQLQNVNGQNVLTPVQNNNMFNGGAGILAAGPAGMVIRAPGPAQHQGKLIQQQHSPGAQFLSPNGNQFVVNGAQFSGQLSPLVANVSPTQVTFSTAPQPVRSNGAQPQSQPEFIQCGQMMVPAASINGSSSGNQQNTTFVQQNTTIVQQQTTMVSNSQQQQQQQQQHHHHQSNAHTLPSRALNLDQNFIINGDSRQLQAVVVQRQTSPQMASGNNSNCRHSVSTQTAVNQNAQAVTTNTFCQTSVSTSAGSPPDTTTHSPLAIEGQSPPTADTTTHTGSTDDGLSPAPSNCSGSCGGELLTLSNQQQSCSMAMVHCVSSSEPDSAELTIPNMDGQDWYRAAQAHIQHKDFQTGVTSIISKKSATPVHMAYAESSTMVSGLHFVTDQMKTDEEVVSSRNYGKSGVKRKHGDTLVLMENNIFDDEDASMTHTSQSFTVGDLVWGVARGRPAWPGKVETIDDHTALVRWFGDKDKSLAAVELGSLQTLMEGLEAHHRARRNCRKSRKLDTPLENAIQEAMSELDKSAEGKIDGKSERSPSKLNVSSRKSSVRLRSNQR